MTRLDSSLIQKLARKIEKSEQYIREQISRKAVRKNVASEAVLVKWLRDRKIGCQVYFNKLPPEIKEEVRTLSKHREHKTVEARKYKSRIKSAKSYKVNSLTVSPTSKLISQQSIIDAFQNANLYPDLFLFENSLRKFIEIVLTKRYSPKWWDNHVNNDIKRKVADRMQKEKINKWHGTRGVAPIFYADLSDLTVILRRHAAEFTVFFQGVPGKLNWLTQKLDEICLTRNNLAHSVPLKTTDVKRFKQYFSDWYRQIQIIESNL